MKVPFTWKVTGWFMIGWSPEFPVGEARALHYFGEDLVGLPGRIRRAARDGGALQAPRRPHRPRRHGGRRLRRVPVPRLAVGPRRHQPIHPVPAGPAQPRAAPAGVPGRASSTAACSSGITPAAKNRSGRCRTSSASSPSSTTDPQAYYRAYPEFSRRAAREPVHPQIVAENAARQRAFPVRAPRDGDAAGAGLEDGRPGMALRGRLAGRQQR